MKYGNYIISEDLNTSVAKIVSHIKPNSKVIEFGSSYGYILQYLKENKSCEVMGYEIDRDAIKLANQNKVPTEYIDLDTITETFFDNLDDDIEYIICADVLEHVKNIHNVVKCLSYYLKNHPKCKLLVSFPNITYYGVISELISGKFKYQEVGILDNTHLHFYDKYELEKLFNIYNLNVLSFEKIQVEPSKSEFNIMCDDDIIDILEKNGHQDYLTYQYVLELEYSSKPLPTLPLKKRQQSLKESWNKDTLDKLNSLISEISKKDLQIIALNEQVNLKDSQVIALNEQVNLKDSQVIALNEQIKLKDTQIIEFNKQVNLKDSQIKLKDSAVIALNEQVNLKDAQIIEFNEEVRTQQTYIVSIEKDIYQMRNEITKLEVKTMEEIDISIVTYNSKKWMNSFFESLLSQSYPLKKLHIYITDNSSTDDTYEYLKTLEKKYLDTFSGFTLQQAKNLGFGHGHNNNFKASKSKFILVTNVDLEFENDSLVNIVKFAKNDRDTTASWELRQKPFEHPKYYNPVTLETTWSSSACVLFRKEAIDKVGGYDDHIFMYGEDVELSYRLRDNGYILKYCPKAVCWHYTYAVAHEAKELQYYGSTLAHVLLCMRYGSKAQLKQDLLAYKRLFKESGTFKNQKLKQYKYLLKLLMKAPHFLLNRRKRKDIQYKFLQWDYEFIRDGAFYTYAEEKLIETPLVSVVIRTCCERNEFLTEAIQSILNQTYMNIELIIVEDGTKNAFEIIENIDVDSLSNIIYKPIQKAGRCHAGNEGLATANGKYMIFLDDDDLFFADHIEVLVNELETNPNIAAAYSSSFEVKTNILSKTPLEYEEREFNIIHREPFNKETILHHNFIPIQSILFKRELYEEYGGFDEDLDNLEDWNLWTRYSYKNDFKFVDKTTSLYRVPFCPDSSAERQKELDRFYDIAVEKQQEFIALQSK